MARSAESDSEHRSWNVYAKELVTLGHGYPLWDPEPESRIGEVHIGAVGYLENGKFRQIFNAMSPADDPTQRRFGVPLDYTPLSHSNLVISDPEDVLKQPVITSRHMISNEAGANVEVDTPVAFLSAGASITFKVSRETGGLLCIASAGKRIAIQSKRHIVTYIRQNFDSWMALANEELSDGRGWGMGLRPDELMFISGTVKTTRWLTAIIHGSSEERAGAVSVGVNNVGSLSFRVSVANAALHRKEYNFGPSNEPSSQSTEIVLASSSSHMTQVPQLHPTQCVFIHYYKMKKRRFWVRKVMRAAAGPHQLPPGDDNPGEGSASHEEGSSGDSDSDFEEHPLRSKASLCYDPVDILLDWILEHSDAEVAIASDRDLIAVFAENGIPDDIRAGLEAVTPPIDVDEEGVGTIEVTVDIGITARPVEEEISQSSTERLEGQETSTGSSEASQGDPKTAHAAHQTEPGQTIGQPQSEHQDDKPEESTEEELQRKGLTEQPLAWESAVNGHGSSVTSLAVSPDSNWIASGSDNSTIILWDTGNQSVVRKWESHGEVVWDLAFSPDSQRLASAGGEGRIMLWDVEHGERLGTFEGHTIAVHSIVWSPDGTKLASASDDMTARVWDTTTYQQVSVLNGHDAMVMFVTFSPDGTMLASGGADYICRIWNPEDGAVRHELQGHRGIVWMAAFDPESRRIATASDDGSVRVWSTTTGEELLAIHEHRGPVWSVSFSPSGRQILSASSDSSIYICDSFTGEKQVSMNGHDSMVNSACFSSDGKYVASSSADHTVRLWKAEDGSCIRTFNEHDDKVLHVLFTPDAQVLTSGAHDGTVLLRAMSDWV